MVCRRIKEIDGARNFDEQIGYKARRPTSKHTHFLAVSNGGLYQTVALTDGNADVKLFVAVLKRKCFAAIFSSAVRSPYNKRTMEAGLWGFWALGRTRNQ